MRYCTSLGTEPDKTQVISQFLVTKGPVAHHDSQAQPLKALDIT
jgi:hypothetical protein